MLSGEAHAAASGGHAASAPGAPGASGAGGASGAPSTEEEMMKQLGELADHGRAVQVDNIKNPC